MSKNTKILINSDTWVRELANENVRIILGFTESSIDSAKVRKTLTNFVKHFIDIAVTKTLKELPSGEKPTNKELYDFVSKNFSSIKYDLQAEVAEGFSNALSRYAGKQVDYYCLLNPTPSPSSKESH